MSAAAASPATVRTWFHAVHSATYRAQWSAASGPVGSSFAKVRELVGGIRQRARELERTLGR